MAKRYQRCHQNPSIEEEQTTQWPKEKVQKDKQRSTKHTYKTKDRVTRTPLKTGNELRWLLFFSLFSLFIFALFNMYDVVFYIIWGVHVWWFFFCFSVFANFMPMALIPLNHFSPNNGCQFWFVYLIYYNGVHVIPGVYNYRKIIISVYIAL